MKPKYRLLRATATVSPYWWVYRINPGGGDHWKFVGSTEMIL